jgi:hypothetical protein
MYPSFLSDFKENQILKYLKKTQISNLMKIQPAGAELFQTDGHTETDKHDKAHSYFSQFCKCIYEWQLHDIIQTLLVNNVIATVQWTARH